MPKIGQDVKDLIETLSPDEVVTFVGNLLDLSIHVIDNGLVIDERAFRLIMAQSITDMDAESKRIEAKEKEGENGS